MLGTDSLTGVTFGKGLRWTLRRQRHVDALDDFVVIGRPEVGSLYGHGRIHYAPAHATALVFFLDAPLV